MNWEVGNMSRTAKTTLIFLTAFNVIAMIIDISLPTKAAVGGKTYEELIGDQDFTRAVQYVVQKCNVNVDIAKVQC
jgi:hypothetical protein